MYALEISTKQGRQKLREEFYKNAHVRDPRVIDMLVIKVHIRRLTCGILLIVKS